MKYILLFFIVLIVVPASGQQSRKAQIEELTQNITTAKEFRQIAEILQMSVTELTNYPIIFPVRNPCVSSGYGMRMHPIYKVRKFHAGIDFAEMKGTPVYATGNGIVTRKGYNSRYGYFVEIEHAGGFSTLYAHLSKTLVNKGDTVTIGKHIACVGSSGVATGNHLHYEVRKNKRPLNPIDWCCFLLEILKNNPPKTILS